MTFPLLVFAIDREIFVGQAESVRVPSQDGEIQILAEHTPLISQIKEGDIIIHSERGMEKKIPIARGVIEV